MGESYLIRQLRKAHQQKAGVELSFVDVKELLDCLDDYARQLKEADGARQFWGGQVYKHKRDIERLRKKLKDKLAARDANKGDKR